MVTRLNQNDADFEARFAELLASKREVSEDVDQVVRTILEDVRHRGDAAVVEYTARFDRLTVASMSELKVSQAEIEAAVGLVPQDVLDALQLAHDRIASHHKRQLPKNER